MSAKTGIEWTDATWNPIRGCSRVWKAATDAGLEYCKHVPAAPQTTEDVVAIWSGKLRDGARRMLAVLVEAGGEPLSKDDLGERAQLQQSGTFSTYLSDLKTARLAVVNRDGTVAANRETLFL